MRNPNWHRDEIILALDLYFSPHRGSIDVSNPNVIELSKILNSLPIISNRPDESKFRNPNGVSLKLSNFLAIDPNYKGKGMDGGSKLDEQVFKEFQFNQEQLRAIATEIRKIADNKELKQKINSIEEDDQTGNDLIMEGQVLYKLHKVIERNSKIVQKKKDESMRLFGKLICEACTFVFEDRYGDIGKGFIECHHRTPLSRIKVGTPTKLIDLALVCSNCHRMLHRRIDTVSVEDLKTIINRSNRY